MLLPNVFSSICLRESQPQTLPSLSQHNAKSLWPWAAEAGSSFPASFTNPGRGWAGENTRTQFSQPAASLAGGQRWKVIGICLRWWFTSGWGSPCKPIFGDFKSVDENGNGGGTLVKIFRNVGRKLVAKLSPPQSKEMALGSWVSSPVPVSPS